MKDTRYLERYDVRLAQRTWGPLERSCTRALRELLKAHQLSISFGDVQLLGGKWYITHSGLLRLAQRRRCRGIRTVLIGKLSDPVTKRWVFRATVYKREGSKGFVGYGDADPSNVSALVHGAEMRVAETRAVNRALRKAYGIGICSVEELGSFASSSREPHSVPQNGHAPSSNGQPQPRLRDRFCLLIRQHRLDASLVKSYAADYCGTAALGEASREMVEAFICHLAEWASKDREGLVAKLSSYAKPEQQEVHS
jgi:hypothetical protein